MNVEFILKGEAQKWVRWGFSNLIILQDRRELIIRLDKIYYFTRGYKVGFRKIGPETVKSKKTKQRSKQYRGSTTITGSN